MIVYLETNNDIKNFVISYDGVFKYYESLSQMDKMIFQCNPRLFLNIKEILFIAYWIIKNKGYQISIFNILEKLDTNIIINKNQITIYNEKFNNDKKNIDISKVKNNLFIGNNFQNFLNNLSLSYKGIQENKNFYVEFQENQSISYIINLLGKPHYFTGDCSGHEVFFYFGYKNGNYGFLIIILDIANNIKVCTYNTFNPIFKDSLKTEENISYSYV